MAWSLKCLLQTLRLLDERTFLENIVGLSFLYVTFIFIFINKHLMLQLFEVSRPSPELSNLHIVCPSPLMRARVSELVGRSVGRLASTLDCRLVSQSANADLGDSPMFLAPWLRDLGASSRNLFEVLLRARCCGAGFKNHSFRV